MAKTKPKYKTADIQHAFRKKYCQPEYASFFEVSNGTGVNGGSRYMDGLAMSLWPSRGLELHGFEFKVDRGDWTRELKNPAKAELMAERCHYWTVITANDIVRPGEMPTGWGHMILTGRGLQTVQKAPRREAPDMTWSWLAAILRRAGQVGEGEIKRAVEEPTKASRERMQTQIDQEVHRRTRDMAETEEILEMLCEVMNVENRNGLFNKRFELEQIAWAAKVVHELGLDQDRYSAFRNMAERLNTATTNINELVALFPLPDSPEPQHHKDRLL